MHCYMCTTCGTEFPESNHSPEACPICEDERQYVNPNGQQWTTLEALRRSGEYKNDIVYEEEQLYSITTTPKFGIGQTAYLIQDNGFNVLWDCVSLLDEKTIEKLEALGGIDAIAISHPHYYSTQVAWAETFHAPIYIHEDDREWVMRPSDWIQFWSGEQKYISEEVALHRLGGHFQGGAVLNWSGGNDNQGILLSGDIIQVVPDTDWVSFMYSYPNLIPLPASKVKEMARRTQSFHFDRIYNAFHKVVTTGGKRVVQNSADRYVRALEGNL